MASSRFAMWLQCAVVVGVLTAGGEVFAQTATYDQYSTANYVGTDCQNPSAVGGTATDWLINVSNVPNDWMPVLVRTGQYGFYRFGGNAYPALCDGVGRWPMVAFRQAPLAGWSIYLEPWEPSPIGGIVYFVDQMGQIHTLTIN